MVKYRINRKLVETKLKTRKWRKVDLANELGISNQYMNYILYRGAGHTYAQDIADILGGKERDYIIVKEEKK